MTCEAITSGTVPEDTAFTVLARIVVDGATTGAQTAMDSVTWAAYNDADLGTEVASGALVVGTVLYDTLQTDGRWDEDATGYNFRHDLSHTTFTTPGRYRIEHKFTTTAGNVFYLSPVFVVNVLPYAGS
jgi:hypothetical protein